MSDETVVNHIAKYHYGIHFQEKYDSRKHEEQDKVWDMVECEWKAYHQMRWYISRVSFQIHLNFLDHLQAVGRQHLKDRPCPLQLVPDCHRPRSAFRN
jgi:hypothetical protein